MFRKYYRLNLLNTTSLHSPVALATQLRERIATLPAKELPDARS